MGLEEVVPALFLILILVLVLPGFLRTNTKFSQFINRILTGCLTIMTAKLEYAVIYLNI